MSDVYIVTIFPLISRDFYKFRRIICLIAMNDEVNMKPATATINGSALRHNMRLIKSLAPKSKICAVVKANAYGQGIRAVIKNLEDQVEAFGVARIKEALTIQESGYAGKILLLEGFFDREEVL